MACVYLFTQLTSVIHIQAEIYLLCKSQTTVVQYI